MNPLTQIRNTQKATQRERDLGFSDGASWHERFKHSAYIFVGGLDYELTEGDLLAVFAQYGEVVDVNLIKDKTTGKSRGFAFLAYENQKSTVLAVDNLSGAKVAGRTIRVDHVDDYKRKREANDEDDQSKISRTEKSKNSVQRIPEDKEEEEITEERDKRLEPESDEQGGGSLFDMMNQFLKKKRKTMAEQEKLEQEQEDTKSKKDKPPIRR
eukprot:g249.t1